MREVEAAHSVSIPDYAALWRWSVENREPFWRMVWSFCGAIGDQGGTAVVDGERMPGARWFPEGRLNFAENCLRKRGADDAIVFWGEDKVRRRLSRDELHAEVSRTVQALRAAGVKAGDRVGGYLPNMPEAVIGALAAAAIGAIWSSCSPDFGVEGVVDRFGQIEPKVVFVADGYFYGGKTFDTLDKVGELRARIKGVERMVVVPYVNAPAELRAPAGAITLDDFLAPFAPGEIEFARLPFGHPLYILYSSGTTGVPKCIVHGAGGVLLQHLKEHQLHTDVRPGNRIFYFTTCGWMMWNWLVSGLASGATLLLYDGSPFHPASGNPVRLRRDRADDGVWHLGQVYRRDSQGGTRSRADASARRAAHDVLDRVAARARGLRLRLRVGQEGIVPRVDLGRHRPRLVLRAGRSDRSGVARRTPVPRPRDAGRGLERAG